MIYFDTSYFGIIKYLYLLPINSGVTKDKMFGEGCIPHLHLILHVK